MIKYKLIHQFISKVHNFLPGGIVEVLFLIVLILNMKHSSSLKHISEQFNRTQEEKHTMQNSKTLKVLNKNAFIQKLR